MMFAVMAVAGWVCAFGLVLLHRRRREHLVRAGHEIRGPLTAAQLALHASARRGELKPVRVAAIELELQRAALALDDLSGNGERHTAEVDLAELLRCQAQTWSEVARVHGASLELQLDPGGTLVLADGLRLAQAVGNVVANAIEHGGGRIEIRTRAVADRVRVEVSDGGEGLPAPVADLVRGARRRGCRGRGLTIAARALENEGSSLSALPSARGACLAFELPRLAEGERVPAR